MSTKAASSSFLIAVVAAAAAGCGGNRPLDGAVSGTAGESTTGQAGEPGGSSATGTGGAGGVATSHAGTSGAAGAQPATTLPISGEDAVTRLAALLWLQLPDGALLSKASALRTTADLAGLVGEMLTDARASVGVGAFYRQWLNLDSIVTTDKDTSLFPAYTPELQIDMATETETFAVNVTLTMNGTYQTLMTAPFSFINARLADIYGVAGITGDALQQVMLDPTERAGLLTQPGLQALGSLPTRNSPSHRGAYTEARFLCAEIPAAPLGVPPLVAQPGMTLRSALAQEVAPTACATCHAFFDPPGLAFEELDAIGRLRTTDNGAPVDVSGLMLVDGTTFAGPVGLANVLASSPVAWQCIAEQWLAFALATTPQSVPATTLTTVQQAFASSGFNLKALIVAVLTSDAFLAPVGP
jgi:hypothetical protein